MLESDGQHWGLGVLQLHEPLPHSHPGDEGELLPHLPPPQLRLVYEDPGEGCPELAGPAVGHLRPEVLGQLAEVLSEELPRFGPRLHPAGLADVPAVEAVDVQPGREVVGVRGEEGPPRLPADVPAGTEEGAGPGTADHNPQVPVHHGARVQVHVEHPAVHHLAPGALQDRLEGGHDGGNTESDGPEHLVAVRNHLEAAADGGGEFEPLQEAAV